MFSFCRFVFGKPISAQAPFAANLLHFTSIYSIHSQQFTYHPKTIRQVATTTRTLRNLTFSLSPCVIQYCCSFDFISKTGSSNLLFSFQFQFTLLLCLSLSPTIKIGFFVFSFLVLFCFALVYQEIFICCV